MSIVIDSPLVVHSWIRRFHSWIDLVNSRDRAGTVDLALPLEVSVRQVSGAQVKGFEVSPDGTAKRVRVLFVEAFRGRTQLELDGEVGFPTQDEAASVRLAARSTVSTTRRRASRVAPA